MLVLGKRPIGVSCTRRNGEKGFALIMVLLGILLLSLVAASVTYLAMNESKVGGSDSRVNQTQYAAEAALEKLTADLDNLYSRQQSPSIATIQALSGDVPSSTDIPNIAWTNSINFPGCSRSASSTPCNSVDTISSGVNQGLEAVIVPMQLNVTAQLTTGTTVNLTRKVEVALIPIFQFGIFSDNDIAFFAGPNYVFGGRIHTNGNLYLAQGDNATLTLTDKISAAGEIVRDTLPNGNSDSGNHNGQVLAPTAAGGCGTAASQVTTASSTCRAIGLSTGTCAGVNDAPEGSWDGGAASGPYKAGNVNSNWTSISLTCYNSYLINGKTGGKAQHLSLVNASNGATQIEIIRQPPTGEDPNDTLGASRLYNMATVRVLLADNVNELPYDSDAGYTSAAQDPNNVPINIYMGNGTTPYNSSSNGSGTMFYFWPPRNSSLSVPYSTSNEGTPDPTYTQYFAMGEAIKDTTDNTYMYCSSSTWSGNPDSDWQNNTPVTSSLAASWPNWGKPALGTPNPTATPYPTPSPITSSTPVSACGRSIGAHTASTLKYTFPLVQGWLRVDVQTQDSSGVAIKAANGNPRFIGVTWQWLNLGFARGVTPPCSDGATSCGSGQNPTYYMTGSNSTGQGGSILYLQEYADHANNGNGPTGGYTTSNTLGATSQFNWFPINFYDAREGEFRDISASTSGSGTVLGIMNAVEIDVANLKTWLSNVISSPTSASAGCLGSSVALPSTQGGTAAPACLNATPLYTPNNGYILYFSDRRHMVADPNAVSGHTANSKNGESGLEDIINPTNTTGAPNQSLDGGEDVDQNGVLDDWGSANIGAGFAGLVSNQSDITARVSIMNAGRKYQISGPRQALRLVNGGYQNLPVSPSSGGFTVASEQPVYVWANYNADSSLIPGHVNGSGSLDTDTNSAPAAIIADAVTLLSNNWTDYQDHLYPLDASNRSGTSTYYRMAIAAGQNENFHYCGGTCGAQNGDFGTNGGMHNFLRELEHWGGGMYYEGSMVSLYYSQYAIGVYKGGGQVYSPPSRHYAFDLNFQQISLMPPGTPSFKDVNNTGFSESFSPR